jgi:hypothetical protein
LLGKRSGVEVPRGVAADFGKVTAGTDALTGTGTFDGSEGGCSGVGGSGELEVLMNESYKS